MNMNNDYMNMNNDYMNMNMNMKVKVLRKEHLKIIKHNLSTER